MRARALVAAAAAVAAAVTVHVVLKATARLPLPPMGVARAAMSVLALPLACDLGGGSKCPAARGAWFGHWHQDAIFIEVHTTAGASAFPPLLCRREEGFTPRALWSYRGDFNALPEPLHHILLLLALLALLALLVYIPRGVVPRSDLVP